MFLKSLFASFLLIITGSALAVNVTQALVPQTGESSTISGVTVPPGGDGNPAIGVAWPNPRFVIGNGVESACITDNLTGLQWPANANLFGAQTWSNALAVVASMNTTVGATGYDLCGYTDWRLPNKREINSLINLSYANQSKWLASVGFTLFQANYWSSTTFNQDTTYAFSANNGGIIQVTDKSIQYYVLPVRGGN